jgi:hypothetical protein
MLQPRIGRARKSFTVPATAGDYAPEIIYLRQDQTSGLFDPVSQLSAFLEALPTAAVIDLDMLKPGGNGDTVVATLLQTIGTLAIDAVPEKFKTTTDSTYLIKDSLKTRAAVTAQVFSLAHVVTATLFGVVLIQVDAAGTISTKVPLATQGYASAPLALAALPLADVDKVALGYIAIEADAGNWVAGTDDMTTDLTSATFVDATPTVFSPAWYVAAKTWNAVGLQTLVEMAAYCGLRIRALSGGTGGTATVTAQWTS